MLKDSSKKFVFIIFLLVTFSPVLNAAFSNTMVLVPSGSFLMGGELETDQIPVHEVFLDTFYIDVKEVTQGEYETVMGFNPSENKGIDLPVESLDWFEANDYCRKLGKRLPTEAEWEKAIRGDTGTKFFWGNKMNEKFSWFKGNSDGKAHPVGTRRPNSYGIYDMSGNVWEWVSDWYDKSYYKNSPYSNPQGPKTGKFKVQRGGSWSNIADYHSSSYRMVYGPEGKDEFNGFRCAKSK